MNAFERKLEDRIVQETELLGGLKSFTPGLIVDVHKRGRHKGRVYLGETFDYYDLASLTKIIFTASASIAYFSEHRWELRAPVRQFLPWWKGRTTTPFHLLTHTAGLNWWKPYFKKLRGPMVPQERWEQLKKLLAKERPARKRHALYSDLDLWMMGAFLEAARSESLLYQWEENATRLKLHDVFFHPGNAPRFARAKYAPTENCAWRSKTLRGEVHDQNTWALGGVAPHAGLFGTVDAVSDWGLKLRKAVLHENRLFGDPKIVSSFVRRQIPRAVGDWGLGFMKPSRGSKASCGRYFSARSFGHTGFTGTSLWMDPVQDLLVVILSNRVHPTRENSSFVRLRPRLHDWVCESL